MLALEKRPTTSSTMAFFSSKLMKRSLLHSMLFPGDVQAFVDVANFIASKFYFFLLL